MILASHFDQRERGRVLDNLIHWRVCLKCMVNADDPEIKPVCTEDGKAHRFGYRDAWVCLDTMVLVGVKSAARARACFAEQCTDADHVMACRRLTPYEVTRIAYGNARLVIAVENI